ncbi:MAG: hypothetical protein OHK0023_05250 [Anaerolineae bacterium]
MTSTHREFHHPIPAFRRASARLIALGLFLIAAALIGQLWLAITFNAIAILICFSGLITLILAIPLLVQTVLHPEITLTDDSLILRPMLWRAERVPLTALVKMTRHPLLPDAAAYSGFDRLMLGKHRQPQQGAAIILADANAVNPLYRIVGSLVNVRGAAFAISTATHSDYADLKAELSRLISASAPADYSDSSQ